VSTFHIPSIYVVLRKEGKIVFLLRSHTGYKDGTYTLPAGHVEDGESYKQAAVREAFEEVGVRIQPEHLRQVYTMQRDEKEKHVRVDVFFEAAQWEGEPANMEPEKHGQIAWFKAANLPYDQIMDYQAEALHNILHTQTTYHERGWE